MDYLLSAIAGYLLGSFPTAYIVLKKTKGIDVTKSGTGNVGAMNSYEITNSKIVGILVFLIDALKGLLSVYLILLFLPVEFAFPGISLIFAVFSHCFNPWLKFKGGRGLATAAGGSILIFPSLLFIWCLIWAIIYLVKRDIIFANIWAIIMTAVIVFSTSNIIFKYVYPAPDSISTMILFTTTLLILILIKHLDPLYDIINNNTLINKRKRDE
jgi:acyl phosphate:glycerol-3-phosphate acyltransferase